MSDFYDNDPNTSYGSDTPQPNPWQKPATYSFYGGDAQINPAGTGESLHNAGQDAYAPWSNAGGYGAQPSPDRSVFAAPRNAEAFRAPQSLNREAPRAPQAIDEPRGYQPERPAMPARPSPMRADSFSAQGSDAPTRIARPVVSSQMVSKRTVPDRGEIDFARPTTASGIPAATAQPVASAPATVTGDPHHRVGRAARRAQMEAAQNVAQELPEAMNAPVVAAEPMDEGIPRPKRPTPNAQYERFDPFAAGDSEANAPQMRRPTPQGQRYTGARTAMPQSGAPIRRDEIGVLSQDGAPIASEIQRPMQRPTARPEPQRGMPRPDGQRPVARPDGQRPVMRPDGQRPMARPTAGDDIRRRQLPDGYEADNRPVKRGFDDEPPVNTPPKRPRYDFEDDEEDEDRPRRRGGALIPIVIILLVIGVALAAICLPNWEGMDSGIGTAMGKIKSSVTGVFVSIKEKVFPSEERIKSFTVSPTEAVAPVELVFTVQTATSVTSLRVLDQSGTQLLEKTLTDADTLGGEITKNSSATIWTLRCAFSEAYSGTFTVQAQKSDGSWDEGMTLEYGVNIAAPVVVEPPAQAFFCDTQNGSVPANVGFTVTTSADVNAVRIVDDYNTPVATLYYGDTGDGTVTDNGETRTWTASVSVAAAYTGNYTLYYQTEADLSFQQSDYRCTVALVEPEATDAPAPTTVGDDVTTGGESSLDAVTGNLDGDVIPVDATPDDDLPEETASVEPTEEPTPEPTEEPTPEPTASPTPAPTNVPVLEAKADASADPGTISLNGTRYQELKSVESYARTEKININDLTNYAVWEQSGVLTFRGGPFRQNSAYGTVELSAQRMSELWKVPMEGSIKASKSTLSGVSWPGQPVIVKWPKDVRRLLAINDEKKEKTALKEVIVGAQNGTIYFLDLTDGQATREPIVNKWPSNGVVSLETNASPILAIGQHIGNLSGKTVDNGLHLYNLLNNKELLTISGNDKAAQKNNSYKGVNSAPIFDKVTGSMVYAGENGLMYTVELNDDFDYQLGSLTISASTQRYKTLADGQKSKTTNIDGAVAMYGGYAYYGDQAGVVQCVDVNTLSTVWAVKTGDNVDATVALDMENDSTVALYTGNTILNQGKKGVCTIRRLNALTGAEDWAFEVPDLAYNTKFEIGCYASPAVGQNSVSDLVFFTVTNGDKGSTVYALRKADGSVAWSAPLTAEAHASPVLVYNAEGDAWLIQGDGSGMLTMFDAKSGTVAGTMQLEGALEASPAVYRDVLVACTTGKEASYIYGIKLE